MDSLTIGFASVAAMLALIYAGMHIALSLAVVSVAGVWAIKGNPDVALNLLAQTASDGIADYLFGVIPLFVLMGMLVNAADVGRDTFDVANRAFRRVRGGLGVATVAANAAFAAITGISLASAAVFTKVAVPEMMRLGYRPRFAVGIVAGSSVLGMLLPPSLLLILYSFLAEQSVGDMFLAGVVPGLLLAAAFCAFIHLRAVLFPGGSVGDGRASQDLPPMPVAVALRKVLPVAALVSLVMGGIYGGLFTPTEAGAVGALGALAIALARRSLTWRTFGGVLTETGHITVSICLLILAADLYSRMLTLSGLPAFVTEWAVGQGFGVPALMAVYVAILLLLGTVFDAGSTMLIAVPLMLPVVQAMGVDLVWFGIVTVIGAEIGLLTPPCGLSIFVMANMLRERGIRLEDVFNGALPFAAVNLAVLLAIMAFPVLAVGLIR